MQVSVESLSSLQRRLTVAVPEAQVSEAIQKRLQDLARTVRLKGFRPGKVPMKVVEKRYGQQVRSEVVNDLVQSTFFEAVSQEKLRPAGMPDFNTDQASEGQGVEYTATFEVYPEFEPQDISGKKVELVTADINDADVDEMIETIRKQQVAWEATDRPSATGDRVVVDYSGTIDGEAFEGGQGSDVSIELGTGRMIAGFEDGLVGSSAGDERTLDLQFPDDYHAKEVAGKAVRFEVTVKRVEESKLPAVDAEFAKRLGVADGDLDKMRVEIRHSMERELDKNRQTQHKQAVMDLLLAENKLEVPAALVDSEAQNLMNQMRQNFQAQGMAADNLPMEPGMFRDQAERRVKLGLILTEIIKRENFQAEPAKIRAVVERIAEPYEHPQEVVKWYYGDKQRLSEIESMVLEEQVVDWVKSKAQVVEKQKKFSEIMNPETNPQKS
jgi:trigger factor